MTVVEDFKLDGIGVVADPDDGVRGAGVLEHVRQRLLHDPVGGQIDTGRNRVDASRPRTPRRPRPPPGRLLDQRGYLVAGRAAAPAPPRRRRYAAPRAGGAALSAPAGPCPGPIAAVPAPCPGWRLSTSVGRPGLHHHHADGMCDHVVQLARDPGPFACDGGAGVLIPGQLQLAGQFGQLAGVPTTIAEREAGERGPADQDPAPQQPGGSQRGYRDRGIQAGERQARPGAGRRWAAAVYAVTRPATMLAQ